MQTTIRANIRAGIHARVRASAHIIRRTGLLMAALCLSGAALVQGSLSGSVASLNLLTYGYRELNRYSMKLHLIFSLCVTVMTISFGVSPAFAATRVVYIEGTTVWGSAPPYFKSLDALLAAANVAQGKQARCSINPQTSYVIYTATGLVRAPYTLDEPSRSYKINNFRCVDDSPMTYDDREDYISPKGACALGFDAAKVYGIPDPPNGDFFICYKANYALEPRTCPVSNPIYPEVGLKKQREVDYSGSVNRLQMVRWYRSDIAEFASLATVKLLDPRSTATRSDQCYPGLYPGQQDGTYFSVCTPYYQLPADQPEGGLGGPVVFQEDGEMVAFDLIGGVVTAPKNRSLRLEKKFLPSGDFNWLYYDEFQRIDVFSSQGRLTSRWNIGGSHISLAYSDVSTLPEVAPAAALLISIGDDFGRSLQLGYNAFRQTRYLVDPAGNRSTYQYSGVDSSCGSDGCGRIVAINHPDASARIYHWDEAEFTGSASRGYLTGTSEYFPANGSQVAKTVRVGTYKYLNGQANSSEGANSVNKFVATDRSGVDVQVTDPLGVTRTQKFVTVSDTAYSAGSSQPGGAGCAASTSNKTYDARGNVASHDDFSGSRTCFLNDATRNLAIAQIEGLDTSTSCASVLPANSVLPLGARKVSTQWHPHWSLGVKTAAPGRITTSIYNGQPDPFNGGAVASCAPSTALLPDGKPIAVLCKQVEQATTDTDGHLGFSAGLQSGVVNRTSSWTYNQYGQVLTEDGPRTDVNDVTTYTYYSDTSFTGEGAAAQGHFIGDLQSVTNAASKITSYSKYNKHGQVLESTDANGVLSVNTYDLRQRLLSSSVGGQTTSYSYDAAGQLKKVTLPDTSWVGYDYDDAHRQVAVYDNKGNRTEYQLDNAGNRTGETTKDPGGNLKRQLTRSIDALGRVQQTTGRE